MHIHRIAVALTLTALIGCGGSASTSGGGGGGGDDITWPDRGGGESTELPAAVQTGRIVFISASGEACCVAVDPAMLSGSAAGLAVLTDLAPGPATVTVAGFATTFAPSVPGITTTCKTFPADAATPCDPVQVAAPAFESDPLAVNIIPGVQTNVGEVPMKSLPFLVDYTPPQGADAPQFVAFAFTVADAVTNIRADSVALEVTFEVEGESVETQAIALEAPRSLFRSLTKRVPIELTGCFDGGAAPCSPGGALDLAGFKAIGTAPELPEGPVEARITAFNLGAPPQPLDFRYSFNVIGTPHNTTTPTPTPTVAAGDAAAASSATDAGANGGAPRPSANGVSAGVYLPTPTPTATPEP